MIELSAPAWFGNAGCAGKTKRQIAKMTDSKIAEAFGLDRITVPVQIVNGSYWHTQPIIQMCHQIIIVTPAATDKPLQGSRRQVIYPGNNRRHGALRQCCRPVGNAQLCLCHQPINAECHIFAIKRFGRW